MVVGITSRRIFSRAALRTQRLSRPSQIRTLATVSDNFDVDSSEGMEPPLKGIKILDFTSALSGPSATQYLGDLGADVWKLEVPKKGDDTRHWGPPFMKHKPDAPERGSDLDFESSFFSSTNRNKRSFTVNVKKPEGFEIAFELAKKADIIVENLITGKLAGMGLGYEGIKKVNPGIIYCSVTGYGQTGPFATAPGYDAILAGEAGVIHCTGEADRLPVRPQVALADYAAGFNAYGAILAGLIERNKTGEGMHIDISMFDVTVAALSNASSQWLNLGIEYERQNTGSLLAAPDQVFHTKDSSFALSIFTNEEWSAFLDASGLTQLRDDPRYATPDQRFANRLDLIATLEKAFKQDTTENWFAKLEDKGFAIAPVRNLASTYAHPLVKENELVSDIPHPYIGTVRLANPPVRYNGKPMETRYAPPSLGAHTKEILGEVLGYSEAKIAELKEKNVV